MTHCGHKWQKMQTTQQNSLCFQMSTFLPPQRFIFLSLKRKTDKINLRIVLIYIIYLFQYLEIGPFH